MNTTDTQLTPIIYEVDDFDFYNEDYKGRMNYLIEILLDNIEYDHKTKLPILTNKVFLKCKQMEDEYGAKQTLKLLKKLLNDNLEITD